jgi:hypothetical protein
MSVTKLWRIWALSLIAVALAWLILQDLSPGGEQAEVAVRPSTRLPAIAPAPRPVDASAELESLSKSTLWGPIAQRPASGASDAGASEAPAPKWSLSGYYDVSGTKYVIVSFEQLARPSQQLKLHDKLPDGARIEAIEPDRVRVRAPRVNLPGSAPSDDSSSRSSSWLPITPGLPLPTPRKQR